MMGGCTLIRRWVDAAGAGRRHPLWRGERTDLEEVLGNLLDNAGKWAASAVHIGLAMEEGDAAQPPQVVLQIEDDGPGMAPHQLQAAGQRGLQFDDSVQGSGAGAAHLPRRWCRPTAVCRWARAPCSKGFRCALCCRAVRARSARAKPERPRPRRWRGRIRRCGRAAAAPARPRSTVDGAEACTKARTSLLHQPALHTAFEHRAFAGRTMPLPCTTRTQRTPARRVADEFAQRLAPFIRAGRTRSSWR